MQDIYDLANTTDVCTAQAIADQTAANGYPDYFTVTFDFLGALYQSNGAK
jgi:hypothetical protein